MVEDRDIYESSRTPGVAGWGTTELSKKQVREAVNNILAILDAKGIRPCEILHTLAEQAQQQGHHKAADALLNAASELRQALFNTSTMQVFEDEDEEMSEFEAGLLMTND